MCAERSRNVSESRAASSSSMTCTTGLDGIADLLLTDTSERKMENCASARIGFGPDLPAMRFDDRPANRQANPYALLLRRDERLKELGYHIRRNSRSGVGHTHPNHII